MKDQGKIALRVSEHDELLKQLDKFDVNACGVAASAIRDLQVRLEQEREKFRLLSAQHSRLCDEVYEEDGETLKIVAERAAREEVIEERNEWERQFIKQANRATRAEVRAETAERYAARLREQLDGARQTNRGLIP
jgi:hypothetical protein